MFTLRRTALLACSAVLLAVPTSMGIASAVPADEAPATTANDPQPPATDEATDEADDPFEGLKDKEFIIQQTQDGKGGAGYTSVKLRCGDDPASSESLDLGAHPSPQLACDEIAAAGGDLTKLPGLPDYQCTEDEKDPADDTLFFTGRGVWNGNKTSFTKDFTNVCDLVRETGHVGQATAKYLKDEHKG
ncbi:SSI family serine proteinase inhibitor [Streptomyces sp. NPDC048187]|uniref:SSI family serine proteinase inhibitor n=1 Tax=Streptomyces sp. NPDC048187 TaxID=3365509 RepID=UPI003720BFB9